MRRRPLLPRRLRAGVAAALLATAIALWALEAAGGGRAAAQQSPPPAPLAGEAASVERGRELFLRGCSDCHGPDARGIDGVAPSLEGSGAEAADFYLRTGRMPLDRPDQEPVRTESPYTAEQIADLTAYVASLGGPPIPEVSPEQGDLAKGRKLFTEHCAGCHQVVGRGGIVSQGVVPDLEGSSPLDVAEAVDIGPFVMPTFKHLDAEEVNDIARYVDYIQDPEDRGGWGLGHIGPIPEGMVAWLLAGLALVIAIRLIGERTTR